MQSDTVEKIETCGFECDAGSLAFNRDWIALKNEIAKRSHKLRVQITLSTGAWLLILAAFAVGFSCGSLCEELRVVLWGFPSCQPGSFPSAPADSWIMGPFDQGNPPEPEPKEQ